MTPIREIRVTEKELGQLLEYSCSLPTGQRIGKVWKKRVPMGGGEPHEWWLGEYVEDPTPDMIGIRWRKIVVIAPYQAPNRFVAWLARVGLFTPPKMQTVDR